MPLISSLAFEISPLWIGSCHAGTYLEPPAATQPDGGKVGLDAYDLVRDFGGQSSIESTDLHPVNHPDKGTFARTLS
jgi:hypothetical protein